MAELWVYMDGRRIGVLDGSDLRALRFIYDDDYIDDSAPTPLSVSMPVRPGPYLHAAVEPYLWGLLPDNSRVIDRWAREFQCPANSAFALLSHVGVDVAGAAQYVPAGEIPEASMPGHVDALSGDDVGELLRTARQDNVSWHASRGSGRWSLAGAQAKIALSHSAAGEWGLPAGRTPTTHILKPAISGLADHDLNEHLCLAAARRLGIRAARTQVAHFGEERALVVERYDRVAQPDRSIMRVHQEDLCQALGVHPDVKYEQDGGPTVPQMLAVLDDVTADAGPSQRLRLCEALAFNWLVLGTDAHAKNYSLLLSGRQVRLAPLYDVASALPYRDTYAPKEKLAQKIGGEYRAGFVGDRHWARVAKAARTSPEELIERITVIASQLPDALADAIADTDLTNTEKRRAGQILDAIADWSLSRAQALNVERPAAERSGTVPREDSPDRSGPELGLA